MKIHGFTVNMLFVPFFFLPCYIMLSVLEIQLSIIESLTFNFHFELRVSNVRDIKLRSSS